MNINQCKASRWHRLVPVAAIAFQIVPPLLIYLISRFYYGDRQLEVTDPHDQIATLICLGFSASISLSLGSWGAYLLLTREKLRLASIGIVCGCIPALLTGSVYLHALLISLTWV